MGFAQTAAIGSMIGGAPTSQAPMADIHQGRVLVFQNGGRRWL